MMYLTNQILRMIDNQSFLKMYWIQNGSVTYTLKSFYKYQDIFQNINYQKNV